MFIKNSKGLAVALVAVIALGALTLFLSKNTAVAEEAKAPAVKTETSKSLLAAPAALKIDIAAAMADRVLGNEKAPVEIIEYASMTCSHCAHFANKILPDVKKRLIETGKARLVYRDFPLDQTALKAAMMARCLPADKYYSMVEVIFSNQERWIKNKDPLEGLAQLGTLAGMDVDMFKSCTTNTELETAILKGVQDGQNKYKMKSTPTFVFNNGAETFNGAQAVEKFEETVNKLTKGK